MVTIDVQATVVADRARDEGVGRRGVADRGDLGHRAATGAGDLRDGLVGRVGVHVVDDHGGARGRERDRVGAAEPAAAAGDDGDLPVEADRAHVKNRNRHSATSAGFGASLTSIAKVAFACTPPLTSDTSVRTPLPRNCAPTGSGAGKRTLSVP